MKSKPSVLLLVPGMLAAMVALAACSSDEPSAEGGGAGAASGAAASKGDAGGAGGSDGGSGGVAGADAAGSTGGSGLGGGAGGAAGATGGAAGTTGGAGGTTGGAAGAGGGSLTWAKVPPATGATHAVNTKSALEQTCQDSNPGDQIRIAAGTYTGVTLDFDGRGGTPGVDAPIVLIPADKNNPPVFEGANAIRDADNVWMFAFATNQTGLAGSQRSWNVQNSDGLKLNYWDLAQDRTTFISLETSNNVTNLDIDHLYGHGTGDAGGAAFLKMGVTGVAADKRNNRIRKSYLKDLKGHRETISGKEGYLTIEDVHLDNCYDVASRLAFHMTVRRVRASRNIAISGGSHRLVDCVAADDILLNTGNENTGALASDYSDYVDNGSDTYYNAHACEVYNCAAGGVIKAGDSEFNYRDETYTATETTQGGNSPNMTAGFGAVFTTVTPPTSTGAPPSYTADDVGLAAYVSHADPPF